MEFNHENLIQITLTRKKGNTHIASGYALNSKNVQ